MTAETAESEFAVGAAGQVNQSLRLGLEPLEVQHGNSVLHGTALGPEFRPDGLRQLPGQQLDLGGVRAFCPFSQIDTIYCESPEEHLSKEYPFEIITFERGGRNIVVSRRGLIEAEQKAKGDQYLIRWEELKEAAVMGDSVE